MRNSIKMGLAMLSFGTLSPISNAYYDDVHYVLTYYIGRQSGLTHLQAYRVASLCSMVDWDPDTEPVQGSNQAWLLIGLDGAAQKPRARFHAMRDETEWDDCLGNSENGNAAQGGVIKRREYNWNMALKTTKNPGAFLHAFQDEKPHEGYGTKWGHWPMLPGCVQEYKAAGLTIGGSTDWISTRVEDVKNLCRTTNDYLTRFIDAVSPHQYGRPYYYNEFDNLVQALAATNPAPRPIDSELKRQIYIQFYAKSNGIPQQLWGNLVDPTELSAIGSQLGVTLTEKELQQQSKGPDVDRALTLVNAALKSQGFTEVCPTHHHKYDIDDDGKLANPSQIDDWVLVGNLTTSIQGGNPVKASVLMKLRDAQGKWKEMPLHGVDSVMLRPNVEQKWQNLPIGEVIVELEKPDGTKIRETVTLTKRENRLPPITVDDEVGIGGHWLWVREGKDEKGKPITDLVPAYLTPQSDPKQFNGVYFPYLTIKTLVRTPDRSPTRIKFTQVSGTEFTFTWQYPNGPKGTGKMTWSGATMTGTWVEDGSGNKGNWKWIRPDPAQKKILRAFFSR
jgi:hypothetical protein